MLGSLLCDSLPHSLETGSLTLAGARLAARSPHQSSSFSLPSPPSGMGLQAHNVAMGFSICQLWPHCTLEEKRCKVDAVGQAETPA